MDPIRLYETQRMKKNLPEFQPGDTIRINYRIIEGGKERIQPFEGILIGRKGSGLNETILVRKISHGVGVERTFLLHSPLLESIKVVRYGRARRGKLYYLRGLTGRKARIKERKWETVLAKMRQAQEKSAAGSPSDVQPAQSESSPAEEK